MFYVYILKSLKDGRLYIGYTSNLRRRILEHESGLNISTCHRRPFELVYYEAYKEKGLAIKRENEIKKFGSAYGNLKKRAGLTQG